MRKLLALIVGLISLLLITLAASYAALNTKYAAQVVNVVFKYVFQQPIEVETVYYSYKDPKHIQLEGVKIVANDAPIPVKQMDIWLGDDLFKNTQFQVDNVLVDGMSLEHGWPKLSISPYIHLDHLTMGNIDFVNQDWSGTGVNIKIDSPQIMPSQAIPLYGRVTFSANQLSWQQQTLKNVIANGNFTKDKSIFYNIKFNWKHASFSIQATKESDQDNWILPRATIENLRLQQSDLDNIQPAITQKITSIPVIIEHLDITSSSFETAEFSLNNVTVNATDLSLPFTPWQQQEASIFATADNMSAFGHAIKAPAFDIKMQPNLIHIKDTSLELLEGNLLLQGDITPTSLDLTQLTINNIKWFPKDQEKQLFANYIESFDNIKAQKLSVNNVQFIDLSEPAKQASGLSLDGKDLSLKQDGKWGLWNGELSASASTASYDGVNSKTLFTDMHTKDGHFWLDELFVPLDNGLIKGTADIKFSQLSQPWNLDLEASGIPLRFFSRWFNLPFHLDGITDFTLKGEGLYGDQVIFNHSVTGKLDASVTNASTHDDFETLWLRHQGVTLEPLVEPEQANTTEEKEKSTTSGSNKSQVTDEKPKSMPATISDIHLVADRGRISLKPFSIEAKDFSAQFGGKYDFLHPEEGDLQYRLAGKCQALTFNLLGKRDSILVEDSCK